MRTSGNRIKSVWSSFYGEEDPQRTNYVCILYDEQNIHYDPLYVINIENPKDEETIFRLDDDTIRQCLRDFIYQELGCK